jgi:hypothetical protein
MPVVTWVSIQGSRAIRAVGLEPPQVSGQKPRLHVRFLRGRKRTYVYAIPDESYFYELLVAASKGRCYVYVIKAKFDYIRKY